MRPRFEYYFRAIIMFVFAFVFIVVVPLLALFLETDLFDKNGVRLIYFPIFGIIFIGVGFINLFFAKKDADKEKQKDDEIRSLQEKIRNLEN